MKPWFGIGLAACAALLVGCSEEPRPAAEEPVPAETSADIEASKVEMSDAEVDALAAEQKVCAVTGEPLGSMGRPEVVAVTDSKGEKHTVLLCCDSCREELLKNPDEHLAKLAAAKEKGAE